MRPILVIALLIAAGADSWPVASTTAPATAPYSAKPERSRKHVLAAHNGLPPIASGNFTREELEKLEELSAWLERRDIFPEVVDED
jgi:hypothetical protein